METPSCGVYTSRVLWGWGFGLFCAGVMGCSSVPVSLRAPQKSCDLGQMTACGQVAAAYRSGRGPDGKPVPVDPAQAKKHYGLMCQKGLTPACNHLADMAQSGEGGPIDAQAHLDYRRRACELAHGLACRKLAEHYADATSGNRSPDLAFAYAKAGCEHGEKTACELWKKLGGRPEPPPEVIRLLEQVVLGCERKNDARACFALGEIADQGKAGEVNKAKAAHYYNLACDKGDVRGCHQLGVMLINGEGIPPAPSKGFMLLSKACDGNLRPSCNQLLKFLTMACMRPRPDADACTVLGRLYVKGERGVDMNIPKGVDALRRGCRAGDNDGCEDLRRLGL